MISHFVVAGLLFGTFRADSRTAQQLLVEDAEPVERNVRVLSRSRDFFEQFKDKILIVQGDDVSGGGFVCEMDGRRYFVTNRHVIEDQTRVAAYFPNGDELKFKNMEVALGVDLVRFEVPTNQPAFRMRTDDPKLHERVCVFGNGGGDGILTDLPGSVNVIGPKRLEITSKFTQGDSGSAVIGSDGLVLGVATSAVSGCDPQDWVKNGSRFADVRRFVLRIRDVTWVPCGLQKLKRLVEDRKRREREKAGVNPQITASFKTPTMRLNGNALGHEVEYSVYGPIVLNMQGSRTLKNPVIRVAFLIDCNGVRYVFDRFTKEPNGVYFSGDIPILSYGMPQTQYAYHAENNICTCCLEGISYYQPSQSFKQTKGIEYFDRSVMLSGGFKLPLKVTRRCDRAHQPQLVAFRLECWQNGSLAGVYNSTRPDTLNSKGIPVDWFVIHKYEKLFLYEDRRW